MVAAALALLALLPIALTRGASSAGSVLAAIMLSAALAGSYVALGGGSYKPLSARDPCKPRVWPDTKNLSQVAEQLGLSALDGAACNLRVTREELALALASTHRRSRSCASTTSTTPSSARRCATGCGAPSPTPDAPAR